MMIARATTQAILRSTTSAQGGPDEAAATPKVRISPTFRERHGKEGAIKFQQELQHYRSHVDKSSKWRRYVLRPEKASGLSRHLVLWDIISGLALVCARTGPPQPPTICTRPR